MRLGTRRGAVATGYNAMTDSRSNPDERAIERQWEQTRIDYLTKVEAFHKFNQHQVDVGVFALKTALIINAGASIALVGLIGTFAADQPEYWHGLVDSGRMFVVGTVAASLSVGLAYFHQNCLTWLARDAIDLPVAADSPPRKRVLVSRLAIALITLVISAASLSYGIFIVGAFSLLESFSG